MHERINSLSPLKELIFLNKEELHSVILYMLQWHLDSLLIVLNPSSLLHI